MSVCVFACGNVVPILSKLIVIAIVRSLRPENLAVSCPHRPSRVAEKSHYGIKQCCWSPGKAPLGCPSTPTTLDPRALPAPGPQDGQAVWEVSVLQPCRVRGRTHMHHGCAGSAGRLVVSGRLRAGGGRPHGLVKPQASPELLA